MHRVHPAGGVGGRGPGAFSGQVTRRTAAVVTDVALDHHDGRVRLGVHAVAGVAGQHAAGQLGPAARHDVHTVTAGSGDPAAGRVQRPATGQADAVAVGTAELAVLGDEFAVRTDDHRAVGDRRPGERGARRAAQGQSRAPRYPQPHPRQLRLGRVVEVDAAGRVQFPVADLQAPASAHHGRETPPPRHGEALQQRQAGAVHAQRSLRGVGDVQAHALDGTVRLDGDPHLAPADRAFLQAGPGT
ncbi:hypothetical protein SCANM63S_06603 [Streptomyces canarius]